MPEILPDHVPNPRTPLVWDGTRYRAVRGHTDGTLQVRGEDQLFSYAGQLKDLKTIASGGGADVDLVTGSVPAGEVWVVTNIYAVNDSGAHMRTTVFLWDGANVHEIDRYVTALQWTPLSWQGRVFMIEDDVIFARFTGTALGDLLRLVVLGHVMTLEV